jgi:hypothetical protein
VSARSKTFLYVLEPGCRIRHEHQQIKNQVIGFIVQLEVKVRDSWHPVVRYDTVHGFAHKDQLHWGGRKEKYPLLVETFNQALTLAEEDLRDHWASYRDNLLQEANKHGAK